jgi:hypothetical protein
MSNLGYIITHKVKIESTALWVVVDMERVKGLMHIKRI